MIAMKKEDKQTSEKRDETPAKLDSKEAKLHEEKEKSKDHDIAELTDSLQRLQAEFENYKKRAEKENREFVKYANAGLISKILNTIDTFEIALRNSDDHEKFVKGMELIYAQLMSALKSEGLRQIEAAGNKFDPYLHEVMLKQASDKEEGVVLEELQKGYMLNGKVLRYSKVKISEKAGQEQNKQ